MTWDLLQSNGANGYNFAGTLAYLSNLSAGSKLIALSVISGSKTTTGVTDGNGNAFTKIGAIYPNNASANGEATLWALDTPAGDEGIKPTVTVSYSQTGTCALVIEEVSGLATGTTVAEMIDGGAAVTSYGSLSANGSAAAGAYSTDTADEYLLACYFDDQWSVTTAGTPTGSATYSLDPESQQATDRMLAAASYGSSTAGTETASFPVTAASWGSAVHWGIIFAAFKLLAVTHVYEKSGSAAASGAGSGTGKRGTPWLYPSAATALSGSWATVSNAQGVPDGSSATWTDAGPGTSAVLELSGYNAQAAVGGPAVIGDVSVMVYHGETPSGQVAAVTADAYSGTVHKAGPVTLSKADALHGDLAVFSGLTYADLADLRVRVTVTRN